MTRCSDPRATLARGSKSRLTQRDASPAPLGPPHCARSSFGDTDAGVCAGYTRWGSRMSHDHGAPYHHIHRRDYQAVPPSPRAHRNWHTYLPRRASFATFSPILPSREVRAASRSRVAKCSIADLVTADGVKSTLQKAVTGLDDKPTPTGDAAYRAVVCTDLMLEDPRDDRSDGARPSPDGLLS